LAESVSESELREPGETGMGIAEAGPGDFIYVPPFVPHQEINANPKEPLEWWGAATRRRRGQARHRASREVRRVALGRPYSQGVRRLGSTSGVLAHRARSPICPEGG